VREYPVTNFLVPSTAITSFSGSMDEVFTSLIACCPAPDGIQEQWCLHDRRTGACWTSGGDYWENYHDAITALAAADVAS
jgi:hypothetical protein